MENRVRLQTRLIHPDQSILLALKLMDQLGVKSLIVSIG